MNEKEKYELCNMLITYYRQRCTMREADLKPYIDKETGKWVDPRTTDQDLLDYRSKLNTLVSKLEPLAEDGYNALTA